MNHVVVVTPQPTVTLDNVVSTALCMVRTYCIEDSKVVVHYDGVKMPVWDDDTPVSLTQRYCELQAHQATVDALVAELLGMSRTARGDRSEILAWFVALTALPTSCLTVPFCEIRRVIPAKWTLSRRKNAPCAFVGDADSHAEDLFGRAFAWLETEAAAHPNTTCTYAGFAAQVAEWQTKYNKSLPGLSTAVRQRVTQIVAAIRSENYVLAKRLWEEIPPRVYISEEESVRSVVHAPICWAWCDAEKREEAVHVWGELREVTRPRLVELVQLLDRRT